MKKVSTILDVIKENSGVTITGICKAVPSIDKEEVKQCVQHLVDAAVVAPKGSKYYPVLRQILVFDRRSEELVDEITLDNLDAGTLEEAFSNNENDPYFFDVYDLNTTNCTFFRKKYKIQFDFNKNHYQLAAALEQSVA